MKKYVFLKLEIKCGEYEFESVGVHKIQKRTTVTAFSEKYAKQFYYGSWKEGLMEEDDRTYYFNNGEVAVEVLIRETISKEDYDVLRKYL